jgi:hypothetical protein
MLIRPALLASLFIVGTTIVAHSQDTARFSINVLNIKTSRKSAADFKQVNSAFYEDDTYRVKAHCMGEFGGSLVFTNKQTSISYTCAATCPVTVLKSHGHYIVSNTLAHMVGFAQVVAIADPTRMKIVPATTRSNSKHPIISVAQGELSTIGTQILTDSMRLFISGSFLSDGEAYHIITDFKKTYLAEIINGKFRTIAQIANFSTWSYEPKVICTSNGHSVMFYKNDKAEGYIDVYNKQVNLFRYL